jgi:YD repeat-containing protein
VSLAPAAAWNYLTLPGVDADRSIFYPGGYMSDSGGATIQFPDGSTRYFSPGVPWGSDYIQTPNGNRLYKDGATDTVNRTIQPWTDWQDLTPGYPQSRVFTVTDANNIQRNYTVHYAGWNIPDPYQTNVTVYHCCLVTSIVLPNGKTWTFTYNASGYLEKITFPAGAYVRYVYGSLPNCGNPCINDAIIERRVSESGTAGGEKVWTYARTYVSGDGRTVTVTSPEADQVVHTFNAQGEETQTDRYGPPYPPLQTVIYSWTQSGVETNGQPNNPRVVTATTRLGGYQLQSTKTTTYDSDGYVTQEIVSDWGGYPYSGPMVLQKDYAYTTIVSPNFKRSCRKP